MLVKAICRAQKRGAANCAHVVYMQVYDIGDKLHLLFAGFRPIVAGVDLPFDSCRPALCIGSRAESLRGVGLFVESGHAMIPT